MSLFLPPLPPPPAPHTHARTHTPLLPSHLPVIGNGGGREERGCPWGAANRLTGYRRNQRCRQKCISSVCPPAPHSPFPLSPGSEQAPSSPCRIRHPAAAGEPGRSPPCPRPHRPGLLRPHRPGLLRAFRVRGEQPLKYKATSRDTSWLWTWRGQGWVPWAQPHVSGIALVAQ